MKPARQKTPEEKFNWIQTKHGQLFQGLMQEAVRLAEGQNWIERRAERLVDVVDKAAEKVAPSTICKRGCSHCCYQAVRLSQWEAERIGKAIGREPAAADNRGAPIGEASEHYAGTPCPMLKDGECSVYDVRPIACRSYFSLENDASLCDTINNPRAIVAYFNFGPLTAANVMLFRNQPHADIREYFP